MRKALLWIGGLFCAIGLALIAASAILTYMGLIASYNLGDPTKFEFVLVPLWLVGLGVGLLGVACLIGRRWAANH